jgi:hypothetical protein
LAALGNNADRYGVRLSGGCECDARRDRYRVPAGEAFPKRDLPPAGHRLLRANEALPGFRHHAPLCRSRWTARQAVADFARGWRSRDTADARRVARCTPTSRRRGHWGPSDQAGAERRRWEGHRLTRADRADEQQLLSACMGDRQVMERLVRFELDREPGISRAEGIARAADRWRRDNHGSS